MPETVARIAPLLLALAFTWAAVAKLSGFDRWRTALAGYSLPSATERPSSVLVPIVELAVAFVTIAASVRIGAIAALVLLALFSFAILRARAIKGDRLPCGCFGGSAERKYTTMLMRNAALGTLAVIALFADTETGAALSSLPAGADAVPAALALVGVVLVGWVALQASRSLRRNGR